FKPLKLTPAAWSGKYPAVVSLDSRMGLDPERIEKKPFFNPNPGIYRPPAAIGFNHTVSGDRMIHGVIFHTISDKPLNYVTITITNAITGQSTDTSSDMDGMFCFSGLPSGVYNFKLKCDYVDNYNCSKNIILNRADLTLKLKQYFTSLSVEQVVTGLKAKESERNVLFLPGDIDYSSKRKNSRGVLFFEALET
ncbi:MAG: carboxypeptidase-like regulatory domain-containing protein, partial [bacterium]|nr:carboxypeptidase-like regulatory domain-containing protein [bacterium]